MEGTDSSFWEKSEPFGQWDLSVIVTVIVRAVRFFAVGSMLTLFNFEEVWMIFLLLPAMRVQALILIRTPFRVRAYKVVNLPVWTHFARVKERRRPATEVLPVVCINTDFTIVIILSVGAPDSLEVEHVKIHIDLILLYQLDRELALIMSKRAVFLVLTRWAPHLEIRRAKLSFVLIWVIEFFNTIMGSLAEVLLGAILVFANHIWTNFGLINA